MFATRRDKTRLALIRAGQKLFAERPIDSVSIDDIVQAANVGRGSFYNHFRDTEAFERDRMPSPGASKAWSPRCRPMSPETG
jgi:AcrR family transcriptional regulator